MHQQILESYWKVIRRTVLTALSVFLVLMLAGCQKAKESDFVAPLPTPALPPPAPLVAADRAGIVAETICLTVEQTYPNLVSKIPEPIELVVTSILSGLGLTVVGEDQPCDATLRVSIVGDRSVRCIKSSGRAPLARATWRNQPG